MLCMLLLEPGDGVLTEQYSYSHLVEHTLKLRGNHAVPVAMDALGVQPAALRAVLQVSRIM
jgi:DNA-binding transcriptional MocR family regulator